MYRPLFPRDGRLDPRIGDAQMATPALRSGFTVSALALLALAGCDSAPTAPGDDPPGGDPPPAMTFQFDFTAVDAASGSAASTPAGVGPWEGAQGWIAGFSDFAPGWEEMMELDAGHRPLPEALGTEGYGLFIGATNRSDDVFMYWTGRVDGLEPETRYRVRFEVEFATDSPAGCVGVGGPPGEAVWVKVGAVLDQPQAVVGDMGGDYWTMNLDKGNQAVGGDDALLIGDVANEASECVGDRVWELKTLASEDDFEITTDATGAAWLLVGTDSGFESRTELWYTRYEAVFEPL